MWWILFSCSSFANSPDAPVVAAGPASEDTAPQPQKKPQPSTKPEPKPKTKPQAQAPRKRPKARQHPDEGRWQLARPIDEQLKALEAIGYMQGSEAGSGMAGVTVNQPGIQPGLNLWTSGHRAQANLMDADGNILHTWQLDFEDAFGEKPAQGTNHMFWRRVKLLPGGDLLAIYEGKGIIRVDKDSKLLWKVKTRTHHDIALNPDGTFWVLNRVHRRHELSGKKVAWTEDQLMLMTLDGEEKKRISIVEAFEDTAFRREVAPAFRKGDFLHTNTLEVLEGSAAAYDPAFAKGNFLLSSRRRNMLFVIDATTSKVVWRQRGEFKHQHDPTIVGDGGALLLFDNDGGGRQRSVVRELALPTMKEVWSYRGTDEDPFHSQLCGTSQRLPNGNTLITETNYGRVFEVNREGEKLWEYYTPHRAGDDGQFVAWLPEMVRLEPAREAEIRTWLR